MRKYIVNNRKYCSNYSILFDDLLPTLNEVTTYEIFDQRVIRFHITINQPEFDTIFYYDENNSYLTNNLYIKLNIFNTDES